MISKKHPEAIFIQLHTHCNAECINCPFEFTYNSVHPNGRMTDQTWNKILSDIIEMEFEGQVGLYLHHEPLIDKTLFNKIRDINEKTKAHVVLSTNGQLLNEENVKKLMEAKPNKVHLNINSGSKEEYESSMKGLKYETTIQNCKRFIEKGKDLIEIEINCPIIDGFDVDSLKSIFPDVKVNLDYWANSRGGLLPDYYRENKGSRFKVDNYCKQPSQNFNILHDGTTIACCMDWMHETKLDSKNIMHSSILDIYDDIKILEESFKYGDYSKYEMCENCSKEMGFYRLENKKLKILLTNHQLLDYSGSEIYTFTLADLLRRKGHEVVVYTKYFDKINHLFESIPVKITTNIAEINDEKFDIAHVHHNLMAIDIRYHFPNLPMVFLSHGIIPFLEQPPVIDTNINRFLSVSEEVQMNLILQGVEEKNVKVFRNIIDDTKFFPRTQVNEIPRKALILSNKITEKVENIIKDACEQLNIETEFIGRHHTPVTPNELPEVINRADIVFSLGRGVIEAMMCGRIPIIFDVKGGDGIVDPQNLHQLMRKNFSGRTYNKMFNVEELIEEIKKYKKEYGEILSLEAKKLFGSKMVNNLVSEYNDAIANNVSNTLEKKDTQVAETLFSTIEETVRYTKVMHEFRYLNSKKFKNSIREKVEKKLIEISEDFIKEGNIKEAEFFLSYFLNNLNSNSINAANNLAVVWIMQNKFDEAFQLLEQIIVKDPLNEVATENLKFLKEEYAVVHS